LTGPWGIGFAFAAGVISFLSPCVLPLVPVYLAHLTGVSTAPEAVASRRDTVSHAGAFVLGFGAVFTLLGASVGLIGSLITDEMPTLEKVAGVFLIILGLNLMGVLRIPWLYRTYQLGSATTTSGPQLALATAGAGSGASTATATVAQSTALSYGRSFGLGGAFAIAWTPCIGPVLGTILALAASSSKVYQGAYLLIAYSAGLAGRFLPILEVATGAVIVCVGILIFLNEFTSLNRYFNFIGELNGV
jgi:cytochrome c-type biogenesis protein